jgi:hypothetical protein
MTAILDLIGGVQNAIAGLASVVGLIFAALWGRERGKRKDAEGYKETRQEIDDAMGDIPRDPTASRDWLRQRQSKR